MTDFLEEALADIDSVFFQEFVEQHKIDGKPFDVVPYEMTLKERKAHWEQEQSRTLTRDFTCPQSSSSFARKITARPQRLES